MIIKHRGIEPKIDSSSYVAPTATVIGNVFIGPHATILGSELEPYCYIATGATILHGAKVSSGSVVAVGALVHANAVVPKDFFVPPYTTAIGDPVQLYSPNEKEEIIKAIMGIGFSKVAFNIDASGKTRAEICKEAAKIRSDEYEAHLSDQIIRND